LRARTAPLSLSLSLSQTHYERENEIGERECEAKLEPLGSLQGTIHGTRMILETRGYGEAERKPTERSLHCPKAISRSSPSVLPPTFRTRAGLAGRTSDLRDAENIVYLSFFFSFPSLALSNRTVTQARLIPAKPSSIRRDRTPQTITGRRGRWRMAANRGCS